MDSASTGTASASEPISRGRKLLLRRVVGHVVLAIAGPTVVVRVADHRGVVTGGLDGAHQIPGAHLRTVFDVGLLDGEVHRRPHPGRPLRLRSTRAAQEAQLIPLSVRFVVVMPRIPLGGIGINEVSTAVPAQPGPPNTASTPAVVSEQPGHRHQWRVVTPKRWQVAPRRPGRRRQLRTCDQHSAAPANAATARITWTTCLVPLTPAGPRPVGQCRAQLRECRAQATTSRPPVSCRPIGVRPAAPRTVRRARRRSATSPAGRWR